MGSWQSRSRGPCLKGPAGGGVVGVWDSCDDRGMRNVYLSRRMAGLLGLGFASGLPWMFGRDTMLAWLSEAKVDPLVVGMFALVTLPYGVKVLWSPVVDRVRWPWLSRRRGWVVAMQAGVMVMLVGMAWSGPETGIAEAIAPGASGAGAGLWVFGALALGMAVASATQDVAADAYRTDVLGWRELGAGAAVFVNGYRMAMIAGSGGALLLADAIGWRGTYLAFAGLMSVGVVSAIFTPSEPDRAGPSGGDGPGERTGRWSERVWSAVAQPLATLLARQGRGAWSALAVVLLFKLPDQMASWQTLPFLLGEMNYAKAEVGVIRQWLGLGVTVAGAMVGGGMVARLGVVRSLWVMGLLQAASNGGFCLLALLPGPTVSEHGRVLLIGVIVIESFCGGLVTAGFVAYLMSLCERRYSATQYALLTSLMALGGMVFQLPTGWLVGWLGWGGFFGATMLLGLPGMVALAGAVEPRGEG